MSASLENSIVVIGYGSSLRGDDAVGRLVVEHVADQSLPDVVAMSVTQLVPELAMRMAKSRAVIFVDACADNDVRGVVVQEVTGAPSVFSASHAAGPRELLALASTCYDRTPRAWLVAVPACHFEVTEQISSAARANIAAAVVAIEQLVNELRETEVAHA